MPGANVITHIADCLDVDVRVLMRMLNDSNEPVSVIIVDDENIILRGSLHIVETVMPDADIHSFDNPGEALSFAQEHRVDIALLDIEMGNVSGLELSDKLLAINRYTNIIFLTAYPDYALDAWKTVASGFLVKPLKESELLTQLSRLRHPVKEMYL